MNTNDPSPNGSPNLHNHLSLWRIISFMMVIGLIFAVYVFQLFRLQVLEGDVYTALAEDNRTLDLNLASLRGIIYDRNGTILARNIASYNVVIVAADLPDDPDPLDGEFPGAAQEIFRELAALIDVPVHGGDLTPENPFVPCISDHGITEIAEYGDTSSPFTPVPVKCDVDERTAMIIQEKAMDWPGISVEIQPIRDYPTGSLTASLVGFLGPIPASQEEEYVAQGLVPNRDKVGYAGLELEYEEVLSGKNGLRVVEVDVGGQVLRDIEPPIDPKPGQNLRLTIDTRLQQAAEAVFVKELREWNAYFGEVRYSSGVVIAINPTTGEILAMVSYPTYENN
ncbi:MAG TPA: hypothetical protein VLS48_07150, partial [Anaerolineales bacterium]|nr:hypothetical protein [Anaerolineales bacterium]